MSTPDPDGPSDRPLPPMPDLSGMSSLDETAVGLHEWYQALRRAGFSRSEALEFMARMVSGGGGD